MMGWREMQANTGTWSYTTVMASGGYGNDVCYRHVELAGSMNSITSQEKEDGRLR